MMWISRDRKDLLKGAIKSGIIVIVIDKGDFLP